MKNITLDFSIDLFNIEYKMKSYCVIYSGNNFETVMDKDTGIIYSVTSKIII